MICAKCGTELHSEALLCWKCGADTPIYTDERKALRQKEEEERLELEWQAKWRAENPGEAEFEEAVKRGSKLPVLRRSLVIIWFLLVAPLLLIADMARRSSIDDARILIILTPWWLILVVAVSIAYVLVRIIDGDLRLEGD